MTAPVLPDPWGNSLRNYLQSLEERIGNLEGPNQPQIMSNMVSSNLTVANAKQFTNGLVYLTDLNQLAYSSGAHWYKVTVGTLII